MNREPIGKHVQFRMLDGALLQGEVISAPRATGDCWIVAGKNEGRLDGLTHHIQTYAYMTVYPETKPPLDPKAER